MLQQYMDSVVFHVSDDCPRSEELAGIIKTNPLPKLKKIIGNRKVKVILGSFFEKGMQEYYDGVRFTKPGINRNLPTEQQKSFLTVIKKSGILNSAFAILRYVNGHNLGTKKYFLKGLKVL